MMKYKYSKYNVIIPFNSEQTVIVWNTRSGSIISIEPEHYALIEKDKFDSPHIQTMLPELLAQGVIVPEQFDEFNQIKFTQTQMQYADNHNTLNLIIAPTLQCNYRCVYCFEESQSQKKIMSKKVIDDLTEFVRKNLSANPHIKSLSVSWFGGEPLMAYNEAIVPLSMQLIELCDQHQIEYSSKITTNGFYLTKENIEEMVESLKISSFQITFDGTCDNYCKRKGVSKVAYYRAKDNLFALSKHLRGSKKKASINLRINIDNDNINDAKELVEEIKKDPRYISNINFYLGRLTGCDDNLNYTSLEEYEKYESEFSAYLMKKNKPIEPKKIWCGQFAMNNLCIGPSGEIYKCEHDFGYSDLIIGNVEFGIFYTDYLLDYINQPLSEQCKTCRIYPICLGGCPKARYQNKEHFNCEYTEKYLISIMQQYIKQNQEDM